MRRLHLFMSACVSATFLAAVLGAQAQEIDLKAIIRKAIDAHGG
jgi:hypothetical protein